MTPINGRGGTRAFPIENRSKPSPEWNHYRIECRDGEITLAVNGKVVTRGKDCSPRKGYICIESEGGIVHYRNMRIRELRDSPLDPEHVAIEDRGYRCLYNGIDLEGWRTGGDWKPRDWELVHEDHELGTLTTVEEFGDTGFIFDAKFGDLKSFVEFQFGGAKVRIDDEVEEIAKHLQEPGQWNRFEGTVHTGKLSFSVNGNKLSDAIIHATKAPLGFTASRAVVLANIYVRDLK